MVFYIGCTLLVVSSTTPFFGVWPLIFSMIVDASRIPTLVGFFYCFSFYRKAYSFFSWRGLPCLNNSLHNKTNLNFAWSFDSIRRVMIAFERYDCVRNLCFHSDDMVRFESFIFSIKFVVNVTWGIWRNLKWREQLQPFTEIIETNSKNGVVPISHKQCKTLFNDHTVRLKIISLYIYKDLRLKWVTWPLSRGWQPSAQSSVWF